jgi:hypothetical protein
LKSITRRAKQGREAGGDCGDSPAEEEEEREGTGPIRPTPGGGSPPAPERAAAGGGRRRRGGAGWRGSLDLKFGGGLGWLRRVLTTRKNGCGASQPHLTSAVSRRVNKSLFIFSIFLKNYCIIYGSRLFLHDLFLFTAYVPCSLSTPGSISRLKRSWTITSCSKPCVQISCLFDLQYLIKTFYVPEKRIVGLRDV